MITSVGTLNTSRFKLESPHIAKYGGVFNDSNYSQAFSLEDVVMALRKRSIEIQADKAREPALCKCGCGEKVRWSKWDNKWNTYTIGHGKRGSDFLNQQALLPTEPPFCACGCGEITSSVTVKYITYHQQRGIPFKKKQQNLNKETPLCLCGCGKQVNMDWTGEWNRFVFGHQRRNETFHARQKEPRPLCKCGCGELTLWDMGSKRWNKYMHDHSFRGANFLKNQAIVTSQSKQAPLCLCGRFKVDLNKITHL